ncbi:MAG: hypothetical protein HY815_22450 [Candidatus Riflebacteria bacterium]|nr:hypothetical protein [Candidatus Riflebacteria bacterium]
MSFSAMRLGTVLAGALFVVSAALAQSGSPVDRWRQGNGLADDYADFNTHLIQIQTVKSIPFFSKTPTDRLSAIRGYYQSVRTGDVRSAATSLKNDFSNGGLVRDVGIAAMTQVLTQMSQGKSLNESVSSTVKYITTPEYFVGNLMGGTLGAALGSMIPVPIVGGFLGQLLVQVPTMTGAMLGSNVGAKIVHGIRQKNLDMGEVMASIDWTTLIFQSVGATAGMMLGAGLPSPFLGQLVGGVIGSSVGLSVSKWIKGKLHLGDTGSDYNELYPVDSQGQPIFLPLKAPAAPGTTATGVGAEQRKADLYRGYVAAEQAGRREEAARFFAEYQAACQAGAPAVVAPVR